MKPRKSWEPVYRFGGTKGSWGVPQPLGTTSGPVLKAPKPKRSKKKR